MCSACGITFESNHNLKMHLKTHGGEFPYSCSICHKGFLEKSTFAKHMQVHPDVERPYHCSRCDKAFTKNYQLVVHMRVHRDKEPFMCAICSKRFQTKQDLVNHQKSHTEIV